MNNFPVSGIVERIYLALPTKFSREDTTNLYAFMYGVASALKINSDLIDEFFKQTNLASASGEYVDEYIEDLIGLTRKDEETDEEYKLRYNNYTFKYNCSKSGLEAIVIDLMGTTPYGMYMSVARGAYTDAKFYYDDVGYRSLYGSDQESPFVAYIRFGYKPNKLIVEEMCRAISACRAYGVKIYLQYPPETPLNVDTNGEFTEGTSERVVVE